MRARDPNAEETTSVGPSSRKALRLLAGLMALCLAAIILATFFPILGRKRQIAQGERSSENLERIFEAKEKLAHDLRLDPTRPYPAIVENLTFEDLRPYFEGKGDPTVCPGGGKYTIRPLVDQFGEIVPPVCSLENADPDGNGLTNGQEGLHIHRRSYLQDPESGVWFRDPAFVFPQKEISL